MEAAAAAAMTVKAPEAWTCARNGDSRRSTCDAPEEFDVFEISRRIAAAAEGLAPESMYADGSVRGDGEGGPGDSENEDDEDPATDNGLIGVLPDDLPEVVTVVCRQHAGDYYPRTGMIRCLCPPCVEATKEGRDDESLQEPNRWEIHCGMGQAKKWKASVRVILAGHRTMPVGKWLQGFGIAVSSRRAPRQARQWGPKRAKLNKMKKKGLLADEENIYRRLEPMRNTKSGGVTRGPPSVGQARVRRVDPVRGSWRETSQPGRKQSRRVRHPWGWGRWWRETRRERAAGSLARGGRGGDATGGVARVHA